MKYNEEQIRQVAETRVFKRLITETYPSGVVSIVSDTFDFWNVITNTARELKDEILNRVPDQFGLAKTVFRPDSGDPVKIICGYKVFDFDQPGADISDFDLYSEGYEVVKMNGYYNLIDFTYWPDGSFDSIEYTKIISKAEADGAVRTLWETFGGTTNDKGYRTLNQRVGLIYGDSITPTRANNILKQLADKGFASDNIVFGIGSYTFQYQTRDSLGFAMKATYVEIDGVGKAIFKDPVTDAGTKKSAKGLLQVNVNDATGDYVLVDEVGKDEEEDSQLRPVFLNGDILVDEEFETLRARLASYL